MFAPFVACRCSSPSTPTSACTSSRAKSFSWSLARADGGPGKRVALLYGVAPDSRTAFMLLPGIPCIGAALFALTRTRGKGGFPHEAIIGIVYVAASAAAILVADRRREAPKRARRAGRIDHLIRGRRSSRRAQPTSRSACSISPCATFLKISFIPKRPSVRAGAFGRGTSCSMSRRCGRDDVGAVGECSWSLRCSSCRPSSRFCSAGTIRKMILEFLGNGGTGVHCSPVHLLRRHFPTGPLIVVMTPGALGAGVAAQARRGRHGGWFHETGGLAVGRFGGWHCRSDRPTTQPPSRQVSLRLSSVAATAPRWSGLARRADRSSSCTRADLATGLARRAQRTVDRGYDARPVVVQAKRHESGTDFDVRSSASR